MINRNATMDTFLVNAFSKRITRNFGGQQINTGILFLCIFHLTPLSSRLTQLRYSLSVLGWGIIADSPWRYLTLIVSVFVVEINQYNSLKSVIYCIMVYGFC